LEVGEETGDILSPGDEEMEARVVAEGGDVGLINWKEVL